MINTGIFVAAMLLFFFKDMGDIQTQLGIAVASPSFKFIFLGLAGWKFVSEFIINLVVSPEVARLVGIFK